LKVADGSTLAFRIVAKHEPEMTFDKDIRSRTVAAGAFHTVGAYVVVFYYGFDNLTAVAVENLGISAPKRTVGSVANFDRHQRLLTLKTETADQQKVALSNDTIVDTPEGVVKGADFHPRQGDQLRCFANPESQAALFLSLN